MTIPITGRSVPSAEERNRLFMFYVAPRMSSVRRLVAGLTFEGEDVDDNFQDVLRVVLGSIHLYNPAVAGFTRWLDRVVRNAMIDIHRRNQRSVPTHSLDSLLDADDDGEDAAVAAVPAALVQAPARLVLADADFPALAAARPLAAHGSQRAGLGSVGSELAVSGSGNEGFGAGEAARPVAPSLTIDRDDYPNTYDALMVLPALQRRALLLNVEGWSCGEIADELRLTKENVRKLLSRARASLAARLSASAVRKGLGS